MASSARAVAVVPAHQGRGWLPACLDALAGQEGAAFAHVVVVDDASSDGTVAWLAAERSAVDVVVRGERGGFARAANAGLRRAAELGADVVALVNTDVELASDWLARTTAALRPGDASVACLMVRAADPAVVDDAGDRLRRDGVAEQRGRDRPADAHREPGEAWGPCGGAALYRLAPVLALGGLDEAYGQYLEDVDLALRLRLAGWDCAYEPAVAVHAGGGSAGGLPAPVRYWTARGTLLLVGTWFPPRWWPLVAYRQASWLLDAARDGPRAMVWHARGMLAGAAAGAGRLAARRVDSGRARPTAATGPAGPRTIAEAVPAVPWRGPRAEGHRGG